MKSAFDKITAGLEDAIAYAGGDTSRGVEAKPLDVKSIRLSTKLTQDQFAKTYRLPLGTVRDWEQNRSRPDSGARAYLQIIQANPRAVQEIVSQVQA